MPGKSFANGVRDNFGQFVSFRHIDEHADDDGQPDGYGYIHRYAGDDR